MPIPTPNSHLLVLERVLFNKLKKSKINRNQINKLNRINKQKNKNFMIFQMTNILILKERLISKQRLTE
jgi:hypothetical protein